MRKFGKAVLFFGLTMVTLVFSWLALTSVSAKDLPPLRNGDIIFQTSRSSQSAAILLASASAYSHMGLIEIDSSGAPLVVEAVGPVKSTPLDTWIKRGLGGRIAIQRLNSLSADAALNVLSAAHKYDGLPYDLFFLSTKDQIYCSELVSLAYSEGASLSVGQIQKAKDLYLNNSAAKRLIEKRWRKHPLCQLAGETFESCYAKILEQDLITPSSIYNDPKLDLIFTNYKVLP
jgi:Permuted papain-like amidase enzyme, YaeF/YiiX, C92 family